MVVHAVDRMLGIEQDGVVATAVALPGGVALGHDLLADRMVNQQLSLFHLGDEVVVDEKFAATAELDGSRDLSNGV